MTEFNKIVFDRPDAIGSWNSITDEELTKIAQSLAKCNYTTTEDLVYVVESFKFTLRNPGNYFTHISLLEDESKEGVYIGYLLARHGNVFDVGCLPEHKDTGIEKRLLEDFVKAKISKYEELTVNLSGQELNKVPLFTEFGFVFVERHDIFSPTLSTFVGTLPGVVDFHEQLLNKNTGYIDFRGHYAVVDGHWTLKELESLLVLARKELTDAE